MLSQEQRPKLAVGKAVEDGRTPARPVSQRPTLRAVGRRRPRRYEGFLGRALAFTAINQQRKVQMRPSKWRRAAPQPPHRHVSPADEGGVIGGSTSRQSERGAEPQENAMIAAKDTADVTAVSRGEAPPSDEAPAPAEASASSPTQQRRVPSPNHLTHRIQRNAGAVRSSALETPKDREDGEFGANWWFLASMSESFNSVAESTTGEPPQHASPTAVSRNLALDESTTSGKRIDSCKISESVVSCERGGCSEEHFEMTSRKSQSSQQQQAPQGPVPSIPAQTGSRTSNYTRKEQKLRKQWLKRNSCGSVIEIDRRGQSIDSASTRSGYYFVPPDQSGSFSLSNLVVGSQCSADENVGWTPQDSSYGAAVRAFGWLPKRIRKLIEGFFVVLIATLLIYVAVKTGIKLKSSGNGNGEDTIMNDDDYYIAFSADDNPDDEGDDGGGD